MADLLSGLNEAQKKAVLHGEGPALVLAGAGSGKTKVLTTRAAHLIRERNVSPDAILLVTFTNKAAQEMNARLERLISQRLSMSGTFHRLCAKILRQDGEHIGIPRSFVIYDDDDQIDIVKSILNELKASVKEFSPRSILSNISNAKCELVDPSTYRSIARGKYQEMTAAVYEKYERTLQENGAVDFDNLLNKTLALLQRHEPTRHRYQALFEHVLVDEYQDVNKAQYLLTKLLAAPENNLFCVGDFSQNIYGWRGADYKNMLQLRHDYPMLQEYKLEQNYRSTQTILDAAGAVIRNNKSHPVLELWTEQTESLPIQLFEAETEKHEVEFVMREVERLHREVPLKEMAVLYRTNAQSRVVEEACIRYGIPYRLIGGVRFYARKEIKDVISYIRLFQNPLDVVSQGRITKLGKRQAAAYQIWLETPDAKKCTTPLEVLDEVLAVTKYPERYDPHIPEEAARLENIQELRSVAQEFSTLESFLENVALVDALDESDQQRNESADMLTLMSIHAAKGLEFEVVFIVGMEEGLFPHSRSLLDRQQLEEERRLCYVAITRAKRHLFLSYTRRRLIYGSITGSIVSRFIAEIPEELLLRQGLAAVPPAAFSRRVVTSADDPSIDSVLHGDLDIDAFLNS